MQNVKIKEAYPPLTEKFEHVKLIMFKMLNFYLTNLPKRIRGGSFYESNTIYRWTMGWR